MNQQQKMLQYLANHHPCFAGQGNTNIARIHLPVCGACNIRCNFCARSLNGDENRPGVAQQILLPEQALKAVQRAVMVCRELQVVGIAGPGDALLGDAAINTFRLIRKQFPKLIFCLSTNGLLLPQKAPALRSVGVKTITVTVNAVKASILSQICAGITYQGQHYQGQQAAQILISQQQQGIALAASLGLVVKVNIVLIPSINDAHMGQVAQTVKSWGASIVNIIPIIPQHQLKDIPAPDCQQLQQAREQAECHIHLFRHCQRCRADAVGIPGQSEYREQVFASHPEQTNFSHG